MLLSRAELADPAPYRHWLEDEIRFSDIDLLGHANNNAIAVYFEEARINMFRFIAPPEWWRHEAVIVLAHSEFDYFQELHYPATIRTGTRVVRVGTSSFTLCSGLFRESQLVAACEAVCVQIDQKSRKPRPMTEAQIAAMQPYR